MTKLRELLGNRHYLAICIYAAITATTLFVVYKILSNFQLVLHSVSMAFSSVTSALAPLLIGILIAYLMNPVVSLVDRRIMSKLFTKMPLDPKKAAKIKKRKKNLSILITFFIIGALVFVMMYALAVIVVGQLVFSSISNMIDSLWGYVLKNIGVIQELQQRLLGTGLDEKIQEIIESFFNWFSHHTDPAAILSAISNAGSIIFNIVLGIIVSIYLLIDREFFFGLCSKISLMVLKREKHLYMKDLLSDINTVIGRFLRGQLLDGLIIAVLSSIGLSLVGIEFAVFIGFFAGLTNIIPYFGPILGMIPAVIVALLTGTLTQAIFAVLVLFGIQQIDSAIISPRVVGTSTGLHPVFVLMAVTVGGYYMGIVGMLIAVPIAGIIKLLLERKLNHHDMKEENRGGFEKTSSIRDASKL